MLKIFSVLDSCPNKIVLKFILRKIFSTLFFDIRNQKIYSTPQPTEAKLLLKHEIRYAAHLTTYHVVFEYHGTSTGIDGTTLFDMNWF